MARRSGGAFLPQDIVVDAIRPGSVVVDWSVDIAVGNADAMERAAHQVAAAITAMSDSPVPITIGRYEADPLSIAQPEIQSNQVTPQPIDGPTTVVVIGTQVNRDGTRLSAASPTIDGDDDDDDEDEYPHILIAILVGAITALLTLLVAGVVCLCKQKNETAPQRVITVQPSSIPQQWQNAEVVHGTVVVGELYPQNLPTNPQNLPVANYFDSSTKAQGMEFAP
eukprot:SAG31_NODE_1646_length_7649_cov_3.317616_7_plen_224_part_00